MTYLGVDYGTKRIGLAIASDDARVAVPKGTIENNADVFEHLAEIINREEAGKIILGVPVSMDGTEGDFATRVRAFGKEIEREIGLEVAYIDEKLTSQEAREQGAADVDAASAVLILQDFLVDEYN